MGKTRHFAAFAATLVLILVTTAEAQSRKPEAEALFNEGKALMTKGDFAAACDKFEASKAYDPRATTAMNLGACREQEKKLVSAWYAFTEAAKLAAASVDETGLTDPAKKRADALEARLSKLRIVVSAAARVPGLSITRDGEPILAGQWNSDTPIDGGEYTIVARATGADAWTTTIAVASEHDLKTVDIPVLQPADTTPIVGATDTPTSIDETDEEAPAPAEAGGSFTAMRKGAVGLVAVGVVALAGGAVFGMKAQSTQADADAICPGSECTDPEAIRLNDDAKSAASTANLLFIGGGVAVAGGVALWFLGAPKDDTRAISVRPHVGTDGVGFAIAGGF